VDTTSTPTQTEPPSELPRHHPRRWPKRLLAIVVTVTVVVIALLGVMAVGLREVRADLVAARRLMVEGRRALAFGNVDDSAERFRKAKQHFVDAEDGARGGLAGLVGIVPVLGRNVDAARDLSLAGTQLADAGLTVSEAISALPDGLGSLAPTEGRLPVTAIARLAGPVDEATRDAESALATIRRAPSSLLLGPVAEGRREAEELAADAARVLQAGRELMAALPGFVGVDGPRRYLFVAENPAELRGTGGLWGAYSIATIRNGSLRFGPFLPIQKLTDLPPDKAQAPNKDYERNYNQYGGAGFWLNINMTPDFPSAAQAALSTYALTEHVDLDGVIAADPFALQALMEITGPTDVPGYDVTLDADSVVDFTTNGAYRGRFFGRQSFLRKTVLGSVARGVFDRFLATHRRPVGRLRALARAALEGHVKVYSTDERMQDGLALARSDAALSVQSGDLLDVSINSGSGTKIDFYAQRTVTYDVTLGGAGEAHAVTTVRLENDAPDQGEPRYIIGPNLSNAEAGDQVDILSVFCGRQCELVEAERNGQPKRLRVGEELGYRWYQDYLTVPSGETTDVRIATSLGDVWEGNSSGGSYRLTFINQSTIRPTNVKVTIHAPSGNRVSSTSEPMEVDGGTAVWEGTPGPRLELEVQFSAPVPLRWWRNLVRPLT
jgi:uncharacterized protein DUF4012